MKKMNRDSLDAEKLKDTTKEKHHGNREKNTPGTTRSNKRRT